MCRARHTTTALRATAKSRRALCQAEGLMKSKNVISIIILLSYVFVFTAVSDIYAESSNYTGENYNFRKTKWGYSKKQIINSEKTSLVKDDIGILVY